MAITASVQPEFGPDSKIMQDPTSHIRFSSVFPKKAWIRLCKTDPDLIWMAWSGFDQTHPVQKQAGVHESSCLVSGVTHPARYQLPTFWLGSVLPQTSRIILCKTRPDSVLVLADCVRFWPNRPGPEASRCARMIRPASGQCFPPGPDRMRIGSGMFTE